MPIVAPATARRLFLPANPPVGNMGGLGAKAPLRYNPAPCSREAPTVHSYTRGTPHGAQHDRFCSCRARRQPRHPGLGAAFGQPPLPGAAPAPARGPARPRRRCARRPAPGPVAGQGGMHLAPQRRQQRQTAEGGPRARRAAGCRRRGSGRPDQAAGTTEPAGGAVVARRAGGRRQRPAGTECRSHGAVRSSAGRAQGRAPA